MKKPLISTIIPLYNNNNLLIRCLDSIYNQGLEETDFEIIIINDGSTDYIPGDGVADKYALLHKNIRVINQKNHGLSATRNNALDLAEGMYVHFVDPADFMCANGYIYLIDKIIMSHKPEIVVFSSTTLDYKMSKLDINSFNNFERAKITFSGTGIEYANNHYYNTFTWNVLYLNHFLSQNSFRFIHRLAHEDREFNYRVFIKAKSIVVTDANIYRYTVNPNGLTQSISKKKLDEYFIAIEIIEHTIYNNYGELAPEFVEHERHKNTFKFITRLLSSRITPEEINYHLFKCKDKGYFPLEVKTWKDYIVNILVRNHYLFKFSGFFYRCLFLTIIKPRISRN